MASAAPSPRKRRMPADDTPLADKIDMDPPLELLPKPLAHNTDEYLDWDSSDEEDLRNTVGNIPMEWYKDYPHLGYDADGKRIFKPATPDEVERFLQRIDDTGERVTIFDEKTGEDVVVPQDVVDIIQRLKRGSFPKLDLDPFLPMAGDDEPSIHPISDQMPSKKSFLPHMAEKEMISKFVAAIKTGRMQPRKPEDEPHSDESDKESDEEPLYDLWNEQTNQDKPSHSERSRSYHRILAPKMPLPGHAESYNAPAEYLYTRDELNAWRKKDRDSREHKFIPQKFSSMRAIPAYAPMVHERFERCLDLYLAPRQRKMKISVEPEDLLPKLPKPKDLQPFPTRCAIIFKGHKSFVRCISVHANGQWLASGSDDCSIRIWEVTTGRCVRVIPASGKVMALKWCPNGDMCLLAAACNKELLIINANVGDRLAVSKTDRALEFSEQQSGAEKSPSVTWLGQPSDAAQLECGVRDRIEHEKTVIDIAWHARGDYFATVCSDGSLSSTAVHQLSKRRSQVPFRRTGALVQRVAFHPRLPFFYVATQRFVRVYDLIKREQLKRLMPSCQWISSLAIHPHGDNVLVGTYDTRVSWIDTDLSVKPYQTLRYHSKAVRQVAFHERYPLFATCSDDGTTVVCHGMAYDDITKNPLLVPLKVLKGHSIVHGIGVLDCSFHPMQPWLFSSGADHSIRLYST